MLNLNSFGYFFFILDIFNYICKVQNIGNTATVGLVQLTLQAIWAFPKIGLNFSQTACSAGILVENFYNHAKKTTRKLKIITPKGGKIETVKKN